MCHEWGTSFCRSISVPFLRSDTLHSRPRLGPRRRDPFAHTRPSVAQRARRAPYSERRLQGSSLPNSVLSGRTLPTCEDVKRDRLEKTVMEREAFTAPRKGARETSHQERKVCFKLACTVGLHRAREWGCLGARNALRGPDFFVLLQFVSEKHEKKGLFFFASPPPKPFTVLRVNKNHWQCSMCGWLPAKWRHFVMGMGRSG